MWLNSILSVNRISMRYYPRDIVNEHHLDFNKYCKVVFGSYVEAHDDTTVTKI